MRGVAELQRPIINERTHGWAVAALTVTLAIVGISSLEFRHPMLASIGLCASLSARSCLGMRMGCLDMTVLALALWNLVHLAVRGYERAPLLLQEMIILSYGLFLPIAFLVTPVVLLRHWSRERSTITLSEQLLWVYIVSYEFAYVIHVVKYI